mgnify:CR=1 FL=1
MDSKSVRQKFNKLLKARSFHKSWREWQKCKLLLSGEPKREQWKQFAHLMVYGSMLPSSALLEQEMLTSLWATEEGTYHSGRIPGMPHSMVPADNSWATLDPHKVYPFQDTTVRLPGVDGFLYKSLLGLRRTTFEGERVPDFIKDDKALSVSAEPVDGFWEVTGTHQHTGAIVRRCLAEDVPVRHYRLYRDMILTDEQRTLHQVANGTLSARDLGRMLLAQQIKTSE